MFSRSHNAIGVSAVSRPCPARGLDSGLELECGKTRRPCALAGPRPAQGPLASASDAAYGPTVQVMQGIALARRVQVTVQTRMLRRADNLYFHTVIMLSVPSAGPGLWPGMW